MKESIFWRVISVVAVLGLFYVGHGLHEQSNSSPGLDFATPVRADGVGVTYNTQDGSVVLATCSPDGKSLHLFSRRTGNLKPVYLGSAFVDD